MSIRSRFRMALLVVGILSPLGAWAQFPSDLVGFNGDPIDDPTNGQEMFRSPQFSGTTAAYVQANTSGFNNNWAYRAAGAQTEGAGALRVGFKWVDAFDPEGWVRLTTFDGPLYPNPALDTRGKVRFKITNISELFVGTIGVCIGVRETGVTGTQQLGNGGTSGPIEWVGVSTAANAVIAGADGIVDTTATGDDVQIYPVGFDVIANLLPADVAVIGPGFNGQINTTAPAGDDALRRGYVLGGVDGTARIPVPAISLAPSGGAYSLEWNLQTGAVSVDGSPTAAGIASFAGGSGTLSDALNNRGTLEHIAIVKVSGDTATQIDVHIDELQFEATVADPTLPPTVIGPIVDSDTQVQVQCDEAATLAELYINDASQGTRVPSSGIATWTSLSLDVGDRITATQTANGQTSVQSSPVFVFAEGTALAENFDAYADAADLETVWTSETPGSARKVGLAQGGASSCHQFVQEGFDAGAAVGRLYYNLGSVTGSDAEPLWVTYRFRHDTNNANARARFELTGGLNPSDGAVGFAFQNGVGGSFASQYTSMMYTSGAANTGMQTDYFGYDYGLTGVARVPGVWHKMQIEVRSSVVNYYIDDVLVNPLDPADGTTPLYPGGVPLPNPGGSYQYIVIGVGFSNNGPVCQYDDISVTFGDTALPFGSPNSVASPTLGSRAVPGATTVTVNNVDLTASQVRVYEDGASVGFVNGPFANSTVNVPTAALTIDRMIAASQTVGGTESCWSAGAVVSVPAPSVEPLVIPAQTPIEVRNVEENLATLVSVYRDESGDLTLLGTLANPTTDRVDVTVSPTPELGWTIRATQTIGGIESALSEPVIVAEAGLVGEWLATSAMPAGLTDFGFVHYNGYVYVSGGRSNLTGQTNARTACYYAPVNPDGSIGTWLTTSSLPAALATHGMAAHNGYVYVYGGWTVGFPTMDECYYAAINPDGSLGAWTTSAVTIPGNPIEAPPAVQMDALGRGVMLINGRLYVINGEWDGVAFGLTLKNYYSTIQPNGDYGAWVETTTTPQVRTEAGCWFHGVVTAQGNNASDRWVYRIGGNFSGTNESAVLRATVAADGSLSNWVTMNPLPAGRYEHACAIADNEWIFVINGLSNPGNNTIYRTVYYAQINRDTGDIGDWEEGPLYPETIAARNSAVAYEEGGEWYVLVCGGGPFSGAAGGRTPNCHYTHLDLGLPPCLGDVNGDRAVNLTDLATLLANFGTSGGVDLTDGDIDNDDDVDLTDLAILLSNFGTVCIP